MSKWDEKRVSLGGAIIGCVVTLVIGTFLGIGWNKFSNNFLPYLGVSSRTVNDWSALDEIYSNLSVYYDGEIDKDTLVEGAKKGMADALGDVYTKYMDAEEAKEYQDALHGEAGSGIGVVMSLRDGYTRVIRTLPDNPAEKAGIKAGDIIYKVNGEEVYAADSETISNKIRGEAGTEVEVTVVRDGEEKTFKMKREAINNVSAYAEYDGDTAIITVTRFDNDTGSVIRQIVQDDFSKKNIKKVVLDLRNNGGGYVSAAKDLVSLWIDGEEVLIQRGKNAGEEITYANRNQAVLKDMPTVVLVNGATASASEIVAGALKDHDKAEIIGETTFGKGVVQTLLNLSNNTLLKVTTAKWYTPNGASLNGAGITPDQEVELTYDDANHSRDPQLDAAKKYLKEQKWSKSTLHQLVFTATR